MIAIDTNVLLRYVLADDSDQSARAARLIDEECSVAKPALVGNVVLVELFWFLSRKLARPKTEIVALLWALTDNAHLAFESREVVEEAIQEYGKGPAGFTDYLVGMTAFAHGATPTFTFDREASERVPFALLTK